MTVVKKSEKIVTHIVLALGSVVMLYPFVFAVLGTFLSLEEFYSVGFLPLPTSLDYVFDNFATLFRRSEIWPAIGMTLARTAWYSLIVGLTSVMGGYVFAKVNFKGKSVAFYLLMSSMMVPGVALLIPQYLMMGRFPLVGGNDLFGRGGSGLLNNWAVLFVTGCFSAYNIFLLRQSFDGIGNEYKEAAEVDGAGFFQTIFTIYLPMVKPVLAVIFINLFIGQWNDYLFPMIFLSQKPDLMPIGVVSVRVSNDYLLGSGSSGLGLVNYPLVMAISIVMMLPPVAVYIAFQKYFVTGLTMGGVKS